MTVNEKLHRAAVLLDGGNVDAAWDIVMPVLAYEPFNAIGLSLAGQICEKSGNLPFAYHLFKLATKENSKQPNVWIDFGRACDLLWRPQESERAYQNALSGPPHTKMMALANLAAMKVSNGKWKEAEQYARKALAIDPESKTALGNLAFAQLGQGNYAEGWKNYHHTLGSDWRKVVQYRGEPEWDGSPGKSVAIYCEQGLGDEINFASVLPDAVRDCAKVILDCDPRLARLFQRSFPTVKVYGTRMAKSGKWKEEDRVFDASFAIGNLGEFYRTSRESFPGTPYLVADPDRTLMWRALFDSKKKPVIGIAWNGGTEKTGERFKRWTLEDLLPLFKSVDAHWVSLEYKPAGAAIEEFKAAHPEIDLVEYPYATLSKDYDDTAALVNALDLTVCMQTAVAHLAGGLGKPVYVAVPAISQWRYGPEGDSIPWYSSLKVFRQDGKDWKGAIAKLAEAVNARF